LILKTNLEKDDNERNAQPEICVIPLVVLITNFIASSFSLLPLDG
jgi:hypothetical protein